ncbi:MAG: rRNA pseudouridine synthase [Lachnospiraceae bacterium]|nr:rRNA pseudouridine synthase [Lachnospiraceae bacterium]
MKKQLRLDKYLADMGVGTRSEVKVIIKKKRVSVNGQIALKDNVKIDIDNDDVLVDGKKIAYVEYEYFMLNKPAGVVSATTDDINKTVVDLIEDKTKDIFPVGRLDKDTEGLLLLTNDGELAHNLLSPRKHIDKKYYAIINGLVDIEHIEQFKKGLNINDEYTTKEAILEIISTDENEGKSEIYVTIVEGKYHQVKRMFKAICMEVTYLKRVSMGEICLDETLSLGEYRRLTEKEISILKNYNKR